MPTYVYKFVDSGETVEIQQSFSDDSLTQMAHPDSGEVMAVKKVFQPVGVTFKGSGFFKTDNRGKPSAKTNGSDTGDSAAGSDKTAAKSSDGSGSSESSSSSSTGSGSDSSSTGSGSGDKSTSSVPAK